MRCYFMRGGHIADVEELPDSLMKRRLQRRTRYFQSANGFSKASSCGITLVF